MLPFYKLDNLEKCTHVKHGFFGRLGGVSTGVFNSLNTDLYAGDDASNVNENRRRVAEVFKKQLDDYKSTRQVHGTHVHVITKADDQVEGVAADALVTNLQGVILAVQTADCVPLLFVSPYAVAACHAGWRGLSKGVINEVINALLSFGGTPADIQVGIGPCIHQESYEVSNDLHEQFSQPNRFFKPGRSNHSYLDLVGYARFCLQKLGVLNSDCVAINTYTNSELLFSCRHSQTIMPSSQFGDQSSCIMLRDDL